MEGRRKRRRLWKRWTDEFENYLEIMGTINWREMARDRKEWRRIVLEVQGHKGCSTLVEGVEKEEEDKEDWRHYIIKPTVLR
jgi:hypothetical protein